MHKAELRSRILARRGEISAADRTGAADAIAAHVLAQPVVNRAARIAAYVSMDTEPGTGPTLAALAARGIEIIVPICLSDGILDWAVWTAHTPTVTTKLGIQEPAGAQLGADAIADADFVLVPALAIDVAGHRLGRGAGYYDRALARTTAVRCALLYAGEILDSVPYEAHDVPVDMAIAPTGVFRVP